MIWSERHDGSLYRKGSGWLGFEAAAELPVQFMEFKLDPGHIHFALVAQLTHIVDVAGEGEGFSADHEAQVTESSQEAVLEEVPDFIDEVPVELAVVSKDCVVAFLQHCQMGL